MSVTKHLRLVENSEPFFITPNEHDLHLLQLGKLYFSMKAHPEDGVYLIYTKHENMRKTTMAAEFEAVSDTPYCFSHVKLTPIERFIGIPLRRKVEKKLQALKKTLIREDIQVGITKTNARQIKI